MNEVTKIATAGATAPATESARGHEGSPRPPHAPAVARVDRRKRDRVERRLQSRRWRSANRRKSQASVRAAAANRRAEAFGVLGRLTRSDVLDVIAPGATCAYCGSADRITIDHIVGMHAGGPNVRENLQACCFDCNTSKARRDRPGCWSKKYEVDACIQCGRSDRRHKSRGRCGACYSRDRVAGLVA